jgi:hypothetical protein
MSRSPTDFTLPSGDSFQARTHDSFSEARTTEELRRLKTQLHHQLIAGMDLAAVGNLGKEELRLEVRRVADELCQRSSSLLSRSERERLVWNSSRSMMVRVGRLIGACR